LRPGWSCHLGGDRRLHRASLGCLE
jgi:hypothetical protein